jgi:hypothetical protein
MVPDLSYAQQRPHLCEVDGILKKDGVLKICLGFEDDQSAYLQQLVIGLHQHCGHKLPISHSASRGWFWDVRPSNADAPQGSSISQARSETMEEFPWHTDCSYENPTPRYFALQVLQHDRCGGGVLSILSVARLVNLLSEATRAALAKPDFRIDIPPEFTKSAEGQCIIGSVLSSHDATGSRRHAAYEMRFRDDILKPLTAAGTTAVLELRRALQRARGACDSTLHLDSEGDMPRGSILLVDNRRWLHARNEVRDKDRHLRRIRWDAVRF